MATYFELPSGIVSTYLPANCKGNTYFERLEFLVESFKAFESAKPHPGKEIEFYEEMISLYREFGESLEESTKGLGDEIKSKDAEIESSHNEIEGLNKKIGKLRRDVKKTIIFKEVLKSLEEISTDY